MIRLIAFAAFALAVATSAQAMSPAPLHQPDGMITQVREACGAGRVELMVSAWPEPPNVKSAGARYGVQGTFAVGGIDTPEPISDIRRGRPSGRPYLICGHRLPHVSRLPVTLVQCLSGRKDAEESSSREIGRLC